MRLIRLWAACVAVVSLCGAGVAVSGTHLDDQRLDDQRDVSNDALDHAADWFTGFELERTELAAAAKTGDRVHSDLL